MLANEPLSTSILANQGTTELLLNPVNGLMTFLALLISLVGVAVIVWGAYVTLVRLIAAETTAAPGAMTKPDESSGNFVLTSYLLQGLDFILAGMVIKMAVVADWQQVVVLAGIGLLRTFLALTKRWEGGALSMPRNGTPAPERLALPTGPAVLSNGSPLSETHVGSNGDQSRQLVQTRWRAIV
jgi:uncharacterized membrane protein